MVFNATFDNASVISWHSNLVNVMISLSLSKVKNWAVCRGSSWSWSYGSWIYTYLCNQSISPLTFWVRTSLKARCTRYNIMLKSLPVTCDRSVVFSVYCGFLNQ